MTYQSDELHQGVKSCQNPTSDDLQYSCQSSYTTYLDTFQYILHAQIRIHKNTIIGDNSGVGRCCEINNGVSIGENVMMGPEVVFYTQNHKTNRTDIPMREQGMTEIMPIVIEDDVWIGARVVVLPGCTIGRGSVIGACSVVSKSIPPYSVAVGSPARVVKCRK
ncbi:MAG: acyltransferase [Lachnospiraceae bacterium]|nr:acyltransferase [Lachnospiraceae bacterium]